MELTPGRRAAQLLDAYTVQSSHARPSPAQLVLFSLDVEPAHVKTVASNQYLAAVIESPDTVSVRGEHFKFKRVRRPVVQNRRNRQDAMYLALGHNAYIRVQPIQKSGRISRGPAYWSHDSHWDFAGQVLHCIAYKHRVVPAGAVRRFLFRLWCDEVTPTHEWIESLRLWPSKRRLPAALWWQLEEFRRQSLNV